MTRPKAIRDLCQLPDQRLFEELATGLRLTLENATGYHEAATLLAESGHGQAAEALGVFLEEEAAKFIILLDAARTPRAKLEHQLSWFTSHLAKGIYAEYYETCPATFGEVREFVERHRPALYLDGPNDVDFIMRNWILQQRDERLYVDYVASEGGHYWHTPKIYEHFGRYLQPAVFRIATALHATGFGGPAALEVVAGLWRPIRITDDLSWSDFREMNTRTIEALAARGLLRRSPDEAARALVDDWLYPLYPLEHAEIRVSRNVLEQERQDAWWAEP